MTLFVITYPVAKPAQVLVAQFEARVAADKFIEALDDQTYGHVVTDESDLREVSTQSLIALHNLARPAEPVKRFATTGDARRRVFPLLSAVARQGTAETVQMAAAKQARKSAKPAPKEKTKAERKSKVYGYNGKATGKALTPREGSKAAQVLEMLEKGNGTWTKIAEKFSWGYQGVYDVLWYLHTKLNYTVTTSDKGVITVKG